jgi:hypothetical protein
MHEDQKYKMGRVRPWCLPRVHDALTASMVWSQLERIDSFNCSVLGAQKAYCLVVAHFGVDREGYQCLRWAR